jgi:hypothetical protein
MKSLLSTPISPRGLVCFLLAVLFLLRTVYFISAHDVGIEHDSGWYLGVARNLATRGIYASYTNNLTDPTSKASLNIYGRFSVQDGDGFTYFPAGVTVGPGYVLPQAILLRIFGIGYWQYKLWPLIGYFLLMVTLFAFCMYLGGVRSALILGLWFWVRPDIFFNLSHEAFSESIALLFFLISVAFQIKSFPLIKKLDTRDRILLSGVFMGFAILTKYLLLFYVVGLFICVLFSGGEDKLRKVRYLFSLILGIVSPILIFEVYKFVTVVRALDLVSYFAVVADGILVLKMGGSGAGYSRFSEEFIRNKLSVWDHLQVFSSFVFWLVLFAGLATLIKKSIKERHIFLCLCGGVLPHLLWFIVISPTGWLRHVWPAVVICLMCFSIFLAHLSFSFHRSVLRFFAFGCVLLLYLSSVFGSLGMPTFAMDPNNFYNMWVAWQKGQTPNKLQGFLFAPIFSWKEQTAIAQFIHKRIPKTKKIYYVNLFIATDISTIADRVFYPLERMLSEPDEEAYVIFASYQKGKHNIMGPVYYPYMKSAVCFEVLLDLPSHTLCKTTKSMVRDLFFPHENVGSEDVKDPQKSE